MQRRAAAHVEEENAVAALLTRRRPPEDFELAVPAREYQSIAASLVAIKRGLLLADDVGLGKTVSAICSMSRQEHLPVLVVTLTHLPRQWQCEIRRFAPELTVHILRSGKPYDLSATPIYNYGAEFYNVIDVLRPDVLGVKRGQIEGVCDPNGALIEKLETGEDNVKRLAVAYLERVGMSKPAPIVPGTVAETCECPS